MERFIETLIDGIATGSIYGALALACGGSALLWVRYGDRLASVAVLACLLLTASALLGLVSRAEQRRKTSPS